MKQKKIEFKNSKGQKLVGIIHLPEGEGKFPIVIYCHGYRSTKESSKAVDLSKTLPEKRIILFRFDFSGRGESEGKFEDATVTQYIDDLKCLIDFIRNLDYIDSNKINVVGNSLGGLVSLQEIAKDSRVKCLVLQSPVSVFPWRKTNEFSDENVKKWKEKGWIYTHSHKFGDLKLNYNFYEDGLQYNDYSVYKEIKIPVLVIHGTRDESVLIESAKELIKYLKNPEFIALEGANHTYDTNQKDYERVINETTNFFVKHLK